MHELIFDTNVLVAWFWQRLRERAARGDREKYFAVLENVPDIEPDPLDQV